MNDKQQLAAMGAHIAEQAAQPLCMAKRIEELEGQVREMAGLLREAVAWMDDHPAMPDSSIMHSALAGKLPVHNSVAAVDWSSFPGWLIDHYEGDIITEEMLQFALADMLAAAPKPDLTK